MIKLNTNEFSKKAQNLLRFSDGETMHLIYKGDKLCLQTRSVTAYVNAENIGECLLLTFSTPPFERPIRPHKYQEYVDILTEWKRKKGEKADE